MNVAVCACTFCGERLLEAGQDHSRHSELCACCSSLLDGMDQPAWARNRLFAEEVSPPTEEPGLSAAA